MILKMIEKEHIFSFRPPKISAPPLCSGDLAPYYILKQCPSAPYALLQTIGFE